MIYIGNKRKIADMIINNIPYRKYFVEPFAGGFNVCEKFMGELQRTWNKINPPEQGDLF